MSASGPDADLLPIQWFAALLPGLSPVTDLRSGVVGGEEFLDPCEQVLFSVVARYLTVSVAVARGRLRLCGSLRRHRGGRRLSGRLNLFRQPRRRPSGTGRNMFQTTVPITFTFHHIPFLTQTCNGVEHVPACSNRSFQANSLINANAIPRVGTWLGVAKGRNHGPQIAAERGGITGVFAAWDPLESTCRHASLSIL